uniref:Putative calcineurin responsive zinc-finger CRZ1 n=1 Tax=Moniliophthora roreri TaxID=221103 RepID=A0A0W0FAT8_MONRR
MGSGHGGQSCRWGDIEEQFSSSGGVGNAGFETGVPEEFINVIVAQVQVDEGKVWAAWRSGLHSSGIGLRNIHELACISQSDKVSGLSEFKEVLSASNINCSSESSLVVSDCVEESGFIGVGVVIWKGLPLGTCCWDYNMKE